MFFPGPEKHTVQSNLNYLKHIDMKVTALFLMTFFLSLFCRASENGQFIESDLFARMKPGDKAAILMVHFGTTYDETRTLTIDAINREMAKVFPEIEIREAYTSRIVMRRLKARGIDKPNPVEALKKLHADGYTHILIQSTNTIEGIEMEALRRDVASMETAFKEIRIGNPLLYAPEDYEAVIAALTPAETADKPTLLVGHGTYTPATAQYAMLDYMLKSKGFRHYFVGTIEGYPAFDDALAQMKAAGIQKILLRPFMFVAGDHANNDIAVDWKEALEKEGFQVEVLMEGLGENPAIQRLFIEHARFIATHQKIDITKKKQQYASEKD